MVELQKCKEVKGVEALSNRLEDVWLGTFKIRTNLSRFGRNKSKSQSSPQDKRGPKSVSGGDELGNLVCHKGWWGGILTDIKRWTPNIVATKRVVWVSLYGVPLQSWGEQTFRSIACRCGKFMELDDVTRNRLRFDVVRMKVEVPMCERVDFSLKMVVQGAAYLVRVVEEGGGWSERETLFVEDQLQRSEAGSSCASGGQAMARVVLDGLDVGDTDSEVSKGCQNEVPVGLIATDANKVASPSTFVRGLTSSTRLVEREHNVEDQGPTHLDPVFQFSSSMGPLEQGEVEPVHCFEEASKFDPICVGRAVVLDTQSNLGLSKQIPPSKNLPLVGLSNIKEGVGLVNGLVIEILDNMVQQTRVHQCGGVFSDLSDNYTNSSSIASVEGIINNSGVHSRHRKGSGTGRRVRNHEESNCCGDVVSVAIPTKDQVTHNSVGFDLAVMLLFGDEPVAQSGVHLLLDEESLQNVDGFLATRDNQLANKQEANKLLQVQKTLGVVFHGTEEEQVERMVNMEVRDRKEKKPEKYRNLVELAESFWHKPEKATDPVELTKCFWLGQRKAEELRGSQFNPPFLVKNFATSVITDENKHWYASLWWKDVCSIGCNLDNNWFSQGVIKKLGNGVCTRFWWDTWIGEVPLNVRFPRLFSITTQKDALVADVWNPINNTGNARIFASIWNCPAPSKVSGFVWQLLHNRIPTRSNLVFRNIIQAGADSSCVFCDEELESTSHLFIYCEFARRVWTEIFDWLDVPFSLPHNLFSIFNCLMSTGVQKLQKGIVMFCNFVVWHIWKCINSIIFDTGTGVVAELVEGVKITSWKWWMAYSKVSHYLFYEWKDEPRLCILR
ncbi:unnamed protein product [Trifolium pratense]|uniref:Uncharacterized protein n=1 Tax=Trifolium pratense TaxID=57577 RepID=A0ACB0IYX2_TRIPR|nr:unnamed protein product [Trifolium pratense]